MKVNILKYYFYVLTSSFFISTAVIVLFWQENGLSLTQVMLLQSIFSTALILSEVPTGAVADILSRKFALAIAGFGSAVGMLIYSFGHNFYHFIFAEVILGIMMTFSTGADSAFLYDALLEQKQESKFKKILGNSYFWALLGSMIAVIIGGFIAKNNLRLTVILQVPIFILAGIIALTLKEPKRSKVAQNLGNYIKIIRDSAKEILNNKKIFWIIAFGATTLASVPLALWFYQPYMKFVGLNVVLFGFVFAFYNVVAALFSKYAHIIEEKIGMKYSLLLITAAMIFGFILMGNIVWVWGFVFGALFQIVRGFNKVIIDDYLNRLVTSEKRASILSFQSLAGRLVFAVIAPFFGFIADKYTIFQSLQLSAATFAVITIPLVYMVIKSNNMLKSVN